MVRLSDLLPEAKSLSRTDNVRLIQLLAGDFAGDDGRGIRPDQAYAVWSPDQELDPADVMLRALAAEGCA